MLLNLRSIFNAPDLDEANHLLDKLIKKYEQKAPKLTFGAAPGCHGGRLAAYQCAQRSNRYVSGPLSGSDRS